MKRIGVILFLFMFICLIGVVVGDIYYVSKFEEEFRALETQRIVTSNKLATAKIVYENLHHVRDLVFKNMDFEGNSDTVANETHFFEFITTCVNDLKLELVSVEPVKPVKQDRITTFGYNLVIEGDFFKFGELCAKLENSRRIVSLETFSVRLLRDGGAAFSRTRGGHKGVSVKMRVDAYRVRKSPPRVQPIAMKGQ